METDSNSVFRYPIAEELEFSESGSDDWFSDDDSDSEFDEELMQQARASQITQVNTSYVSDTLLNDKLSRVVGNGDNIDKHEGWINGN